MGGMGWEMRRVGMISVTVFVKDLQCSCLLYCFLVVQCDAILTDSIGSAERRLVSGFVVGQRLRLQLLAVDNRIVVERRKSLGSLLLPN